MRFALAQMTSAPDVSANLAFILRSIARAARWKADAVLFPENCLYLGLPASVKGAALAIERCDALGKLASACAASKIAILIGSYPERVGSKLFNSSVWIDARGRVAAKYRKIHLFDAVTPNGERYRESDYFSPGTRGVDFDWRGSRLGLSVCYDVRFPDHYARMKRRRVDCIFVPSAFTVETGAAHWHTLLRARAIENFAFVFAPAQTGTHPTGRKTFGHALAVSPWGTVLADMGSKPGLRIVDFDPEETRTVRRRFESRRIAPRAR